MADRPAKIVSRGLLYLLGAAFLLLGAFALLIIALGSPSPLRLVLAVVLLALALLFLRSGYAALGTVKADAEAKDGNAGETRPRDFSTENEPGRRTQGGEKADDRMDP